MANIEVRAGKAFVKKDDAAMGDVTGIIGITGFKSGTISVTFTDASIFAIVSNMLGEPITELGQDIKDAVGELTNMISGQARRGLDEIGLTFSGGIPTVVMGKGHSISHITKGPILAIPFTTAHGDFTVEVCIEP